MSNSFQSIRLSSGNVLISWTDSTGHRFQVYREVGTNGPEDKGAILANRDLPLTATAQEALAVVAELAA